MSDMNGSSHPRVLLEYLPLLLLLVLLLVQAPASEGDS
jgi:hypothetical protein